MAVCDLAGPRLTLASDRFESSVADCRSETDQSKSRGGGGEDSLVWQPPRRQT